MSDDLDALVRLAEGATPGEWKPGDGYVWQWGTGDVLGQAMHMEDAAYIAAVSPDVLLRLVERVRVAERAVLAHTEPHRSDASGQVALGSDDE